MRATRTTGWVAVAVALTVTASVAASHADQVGVKSRAADTGEPGTILMSSVTVRGGTDEQRQLAHWAVSRFRAADLVLPTVELRFHTDPSACGDHFGFYRAGIVNMCGINVNLMARRNLLHEISHAWVEANLTEEQRERFLRFCGITSWNSPSVDWRERGSEQAAEILAWYLGERILTPTVPGNEPGQLADAVTILTEDRVILVRSDAERISLFQNNPELLKLGVTVLVEPIPGNALPPAPTRAPPLAGQTASSSVLDSPWSQPGDDCAARHDGVDRLQQAVGREALIHGGGVHRAGACRLSVMRHGRQGEGKTHRGRGG